MSARDPILREDLSAAMTARLGRAGGFVFDMDGTLVLGDRRNRGLQPLPGSIELTSYLHEQGVPFVVVTNGTTRTPAGYADVMRSLGFPVGEGDLLTPVSAALELFEQQRYRRVMVLGGDGLTQPLLTAGFEVVPPVKDSGADAVLVGWHREVTFDDLEAACDAVWAGARFYSSSQSMFFATAEGRVLGTSRAISAVVRDLTGAHIEVVGKPSVHTLSAAARRVGVSTEELAVVGDDPELEMAMAHQGGSLAVSVSTGVQSHASLATLPPHQAPDIGFSGVDELYAVYRHRKPSSGEEPDEGQ